MPVPSKIMEEAERLRNIPQDALTPDDRARRTHSVLATLSCPCPSCGQAMSQYEAGGDSFELGSAELSEFECTGCGVGLKVVPSSGVGGRPWSWAMTG